MKLTSAVTLYELIFFILFTCSLWIFKWVFDFVHAGMIGQILVGVLFVSLPQADLWPGSHGIELVGNLGVIVIIFEGGMSIKLETLRKVGLRALLVATVGVALPLGSGIGILVWMGYSVIEGFAGGAALASTSNVMGVALMQKQRLLETPFGALLTAATMIDDIFSLILISVVSSIPYSASSGIDKHIPSGKLAWAIMRTIVASVGTMVVGLVMIVIVKRFVQLLEEELVPEKVEMTENRGLLVAKRWIARRLDTMLISGMFFLAFASALSAEMAGASRLLGCFVAGMAFGEVPTCRRLWTSAVSGSKPLLEGYFFASIGFFLPIRSMFDRKNALYGLGYAASSALTKFATAVCIRPWTHGVTAGLAMITRGELGLLLAQQALTRGVLSDSCFIVVCWAVILCTIFPPFFFGMLLKRFREDIIDTPQGSTGSRQMEAE